VNIKNQGGVDFWTPSYPPSNSAETYERKRTEEWHLMVIYKSDISMLFCLGKQTCKGKFRTQTKRSHDLKTSAQ
jgi:hypothetical protein